MVLGSINGDDIKGTDSTVVGAIRQRVLKLMGRVRIPKDTPIGQAKKKGKGFWRS